jgi:glycosyltransferase involved in cell wall biosynthesis
MFLAEAMASVVSQSLTAWQLTVSEDGPGGGEVARIVDPFLSDVRVRYVATGERGGAAANMTALIRQGSSPYVALLHDDDRWDADFLERRVAFLEAHPECGFVFGADDTIDENGQQVGPWKRLLPEGVYPPEQFVPRLLRRNVVSPPTLLVRRAAYEAVGPAFDERFPTIYDYEMIVRLAVRFPAGYIPVCDAHWRRHGHQSSFVNYMREAEHRRFLDHVDALLARELPSIRFGSLARRRRLSAWLRYMAFNGLEQGDRKSAASQLVRSIRTYPPAGLDPRVASGFAALALGRPGRHALHIARRATRRQRERLPER